MKSKPKFETLAIKSVENYYKTANPVSTPIYLSSTYIRNKDSSYNDDLIYARNDNPNRKIVEQSMAQLENGKYAFSFASGMAAISAVFQTLQPGDHVLIPDDIYYAIKKLLTTVLSRWKLTYDLVPMDDINEVKKHIRPETALIWVETPSNPMLKISDIKALTNLTHNNSILTVVDNTWATPVTQNPLDLGADIVMHSGTKYIGGHSDIVNGCLVVNNEGLAKTIGEIQVLSGAIPSPFDSWLLARGIQTLHLRFSKQSENAIKLAQYLENHNSIESVKYPGLKGHPGHHIARKQMKQGFGAMISVLIDPNKIDAFEVSTRLKSFTTATSLGGVESLVEHRKSVEGIDSQTPENLLRISVGIEHIDDLISDWEQALTIE